MANFDFDQAEGLRRMLAGSKPRIVTFETSALVWKPIATVLPPLTSITAVPSKSGSDWPLMITCSEMIGSGEPRLITAGDSAVALAMLKVIVWSPGVLLA